MYTKCIFGKKALFLSKLYWKIIWWSIMPNMKNMLTFAPIYNCPMLEVTKMTS